MVFNRDSRSGGGGPASRQGGRNFGRRSFDGGGGQDRQMFKTTCSNCGKECEVPFKPTGSKPVYCRDCFRTMGPDSRHTDDRGSRKPNFDNGGGLAQPQYREQFETLNAKLDKILKLLNPESSKVEDATNNVENGEPIKKKVRVKKLAPTEDTVEAPTE